CCPICWTASPWRARIRAPRRTIWRARSIACSARLGERPGGGTVAPQRRHRIGREQRPRSGCGALGEWPSGARARATGRGGAAWLSWRSALAVLPSLVAGALAAATLGGAPGRSRRAVTWFAAGATVFGLAAYADIRAAARDATDRWLADTRLLMQEAVVRVPELRFSLSALAPIARGTELLPGDSAASAPWRRIVAG